MDAIDPILSIASSIYSLCEQVKANKKRCRRVADRVRTLEGLVLAIKQSGSGQTCDIVDRALHELLTTLTSAKDLMKKYTSANLIERIMKSYSHGDDFAEVNDRLNDNFQILSGAMQVDHSNIMYKVFDETPRKEQDELDGKADDEEMKKLFQEWMKVMQKILENIEKPSVTSQGIQEIKPQELTYEFPKKPFFTTSTSEVYKGQYRGFTVAIKRYTDPMSNTPSEVRRVFMKEVETMRRFESPNILRMFGICVQDENGPNPQFLLIMEYCQKGSLRQVLDSTCKMSWNRKARMCLDAAQGLYRLHQTEEKSKVHGCINSCKFLVAEGYRVKLGGLELAKTETSLRKKKPEKKISSLCYSSPQELDDINFIYNKECEIYSFGIVLWEIATRKKPFEGDSRVQIYQKVCKDKFQEELPDDCPETLRDLINACRAYNSFDRPSAGVLVDKLRSVAEKLDEE